MHYRHRQTDGQTDWHHGISARCIAYITSRAKKNIRRDVTYRNAVIEGPIATATNNMHKSSVWFLRYATGQTDKPSDMLVIIFAIRSEYYDNKSLNDYITSAGSGSIGLI